MTTRSENGRLGLTRLTVTYVHAKITAHPAANSDTSSSVLYSFARYPTMGDSEGK
jgi:hypothetical protein